MYLFRDMYVLVKQPWKQIREGKEEPGIELETDKLQYLFTCRLYNLY